MASHNGAVGGWSRCGARAPAWSFPSGLSGASATSSAPVADGSDCEAILLPPAGSRGALQAKWRPRPQGLAGGVRAGGVGGASRGGACCFLRRSAARAAPARLRLSAVDMPGRRNHDGRRMGHRRRGASGGRRSCWGLPSTRPGRGLGWDGPRGARCCYAPRGGARGSCKASSALWSIGAASTWRSACASVVHSRPGRDGPEKARRQVWLRLRGRPCPRASGDTGRRPLSHSCRQRCLGGVHERALDAAVRPGPVGGAFQRARRLLGRRARLARHVLRQIGPRLSDSLVAARRLPWGLLT